ncbi:MAG: hypothetical protein J2P19_23385 [Pseudonocardia sp.]|nr:hypothetical protein [Pseudonocardia sp.]
MKDSANRCVSAEALIGATDQERMLWGREAARRIVVAISEDAENDVLTPAEAIGLIERVWAPMTDWR